MATPNYGYEKRQRELAKKAKKAEKQRDKAERKTSTVPQLAEPEAPPENVPAAPAAD